MESTVREIASRNFETGNFKFRMKMYRPYFLWRFWWFILRIALIIRKLIATLMKNPTVSLIIGTLIVYAIMKFILHWI